MSKLKAIKPKKAKPQKPKILIFGKAGSGKTWSSLDFPACYYIDTEGGATLKLYTDKLANSGGVYFGVDEGSLDFETVIEQVQALTTEKHPYKTLVIDSITKLFDLCVSAEAERLGEKDAFGASKKPAIAYMRSLINWLSRIDMNVILVCHEKDEWLKGESIGKAFDCWNKLEYELDLTLHIFKAGASHKARVGKTRLESFPSATVFDWSYNDFAELYGKDVIELDSIAVELITKEQYSVINKLLDTVKMPDGQEAKWLKAAKVEAWKDISKEKAQSIIDYIKKTYLNTEKGD